MKSKIKMILKINKQGGDFYFFYIFIKKKILVSLVCLSWLYTLVPLIPTRSISNTHEYI